MNHYIRVNYVLRVYDLTKEYAEVRSEIYLGFMALNEARHVLNALRVVLPDCCGAALAPDRVTRIDNRQKTVDVVKEARNVLTWSGK